MRATKAGKRTRIRPGDHELINETGFEVGSGNVFADIGFKDSGERLAKSRLAGQINEIIEKNGWDQATAAIKLGTHQPVISALKRGRLRSITYDRLVNWLVMLGWSVEIKLVISARPHVAVAVAR